jgi:hypothetical protein
MEGPHISKGEGSFFLVSNPKLFRMNDSEFLRLPNLKAEAVFFRPLFILTCVSQEPGDPAHHHQLGGGGCVHQPQQWPRSGLPGRPHCQSSKLPASI